MSLNKLWALGWVLVASCCFVYAGCGDDESNTVAPLPDPEADTTPPLVPTGLDVELVNGSLQITWTPNSDPDLAHYVLQRRVDSDGVWIQVSEDTATSYTDVYRRHVYYRVRAVDTSENMSAYSTPRVYMSSNGGHKLPTRPLEPNY
jgi:hypothetical protein